MNDGLVRRVENCNANVEDEVGILIGGTVSFNIHPRIILRYAKPPVSINPCFLAIISISTIFFQECRAGVVLMSRIWSRSRKWYL